MATVTLTIDNSKIQSVIDAMKWYQPIPTDANGTPLFTDAQWAKEAVRRWIIAQVKRHQDVKAKEAINNPIDDTLVT